MVGEHERTKSGREEILEERRKLYTVNNLAEFLRRGRPEDHGRWKRGVLVHVPEHLVVGAPVGELVVLILVVDVHGDVRAAAQSGGCDGLYAGSARSTGSKRAAERLRHTLPRQPSQTHPRGGEALRNATQPGHRTT